MTHDYAIGSRHWPGLGKLVEELAELQQVLAKIVGRGGTEAPWKDGTADLRENLIEELADVHAALGFFMKMNGLISSLDDADKFENRHIEKSDTYFRWHFEQRELTPEEHQREMSRMFGHGMKKEGGE